MSNVHSPDKGYDLISKGAEICLSCGGCCNGILGNHVELEADETELVSQLGLTPYQKKVDYEAFCLPCSCLKDSKCSAYARRPKRCSHYQCKLLKEYLQGTTSFEDSMKLVKKAPSLMETIYQHIGGVDSSKTIWEQIEDFMELQEGSVNSEESRRINVQLLLDMKKLSTICKHLKPGFFVNVEIKNIFHNGKGVIKI